MDGGGYGAGAGGGGIVLAFVYYMCSKHGGSWQGFTVNFPQVHNPLPGLRDFVMHMGRKDRRALKKFRQEAEHTSNQRRSNREKHQSGQRRKNQDKGGEKGDRRRTY